MSNTPIIHRSVRHILIGLIVFLLLTAVSCDRQSPGNDAGTNLDVAPKQPEALESAGGEATELILDQSAAPVAAAFSEVIISEGVQVAFSVAPYSESGPARTDILEGEYALVKFKITDTATETGLPELNPSAWISLAQTAEGGETITCGDKIQSYLQGSLTFRPAINLNSYFIMVMNNDATISVLDPTVNVASMTQLYKMILLNRPGEDWATNQAGERLFVTMPAADQIAIIDTETLDMIRSVEAGSNPVRVRLAPNDTAVWVGNDATNPAESGVTVIDPDSPESLAFIPTGGGHHEIAFSTDGRIAYVTNLNDGALSVIDADRLEKITNISVGAEPVAVAVSSHNGAAYVASRVDGTITVIDGITTVAQIEASPGLSRLRFSPDGRWGFATNPVNGFITVLDAANNQIAYEIESGNAPNQIAFSNTFAYIRSEGAAEVVSIPLAELGQTAPLSVTRLPIGQNAPGATTFPAAADAVFPTPGDGAALVANPVDRLIYYYVEGSSAPLGSFQAHGRIPRAILPIDRSLRETEPGVYEARIRVPQFGNYQVAFFLNAPQIAHCFNFIAEENPIYAQNRLDGTPQIELLNDTRQLSIGEKFTLRFKLTHPVTNEPVSGLEDVHIFATLPTGWSSRFPAQPLDDGVYETILIIPASGPTYVYFAIPSLQLDFEDLSNIVLNTQADN